MSRTGADWEIIEREYRAGILSVREIARRAGITEAPVRRRAKTKGWTRDLSSQVRARAREKLASTRVEVETNKRQARAAASSEDAASTRAVSEAEAIERGASQIERVVLVHRRNVKQGREIIETMLDELRSECDHRDLLAELAEGQITDGDVEAQAAAILRKAVSLRGRAGVMRDLSQSMQKIIVLERQAYSVDEVEKESGVGDLPRETLKAIIERLKGDA